MAHDEQAFIRCHYTGSDLNFGMRLALEMVSCEVKPKGDTSDPRTNCE